MMTTFTLTKSAVLDAVVRKIPSFWSSNPTALIAPRTQTRGWRNNLRCRRRVIASTVSPRTAPMAIRAKVRNSGSTVPTVSLLPGNEVPQRMLANKMRTTSRSRAFTSRGRTIPALSLSPPRFLRVKRKKFKGFSRSPEWRVGSHVTASRTGDRNSFGAEDRPRKTDRNRSRGARPGGDWRGRRLLPDPAARSDRYDQGRVHDFPDRALQ